MVDFEAVDNTNPDQHAMYLSGADRYEKFESSEELKLLQLAARARTAQRNVANLPPLEEDTLLITTGKRAVGIYANRFLIQEQANALWEFADHNYAYSHIIWPPTMRKRRQQAAQLAAELIQATDVHEEAVQTDFDQFFFGESR